MLLTQPSATEYPIAGFLAQIRFDRIVLDISYRIREMLVVPNITVEVVFHPELTPTTENSIRLM